MVTKIFSKSFSCSRVCSPFCIQYLTRCELSASPLVMESSAITKPPNVLVYTGEDTDRQPHSKSIASNLKFCLNPESYVVYHLSPSESIKDPWIDNAEVLIVSCAKNSPLISGDIAKKFDSYSKNGSILNFCTNLEFPHLGVTNKNAEDQVIATITYKEWKDVTVKRGCFSFVCDSSFDVLARDECGEPVIFKSKDRSIILSNVHLEIDAAVASSDEEVFASLNVSNANRLNILRDLLSSHLHLNCEVQDLPKLTPCFLFSKDKHANSQTNLFSMRLNLKKPEIFFVDCTTQTSQLPEASDELLPVYVDAPSNLYGKYFDKDKFFKALKTKSFGHNVFFVDVVGTTMDLLDSLQQFEKSVIIASIQTQGKGRGRNKWISPYGCAAFSTNFSLSLSSRLGRSLSLIQQLVALAFVLAVRKLPGYKNIDVRIKWPNDIYYGNKCKIGGILVNCSIQGDDVKVLLGCGVNVSNSKPTLCLNDVIHFHNRNSESKLADLSREELIALTLNEFEELVEDFQVNGPDKVLSLIYSYWLHSGQTVTIDSLKQKATVIGLDEFGYLLVETEGGLKMSLQPDGNSFDMLKNLICLRQL